MEPLSGGSRYPSYKGGGGRSSIPRDNGGAGLQKKVFRPFGPHFGRKIRGRGASHPASPLSLLPLPRVFDTLQYFDTICPSLKSL